MRRSIDDLTNYISGASLPKEWTSSHFTPFNFAAAAADWPEAVKFLNVHGAENLLMTQEYCFLSMLL